MHVPVGYIGTDPPRKRKSRFGEALDASGRTLTDTFTNDDGTKAAIAYDIAGAYAWTSREVDTNVAGQMTQEVFINDNGSTLTVDRDPTNTQPWDVKTTLAAPNGNSIYVVTTGTHEALYLGSGGIAGTPLAQGDDGHP
jgi:hypothetical protein